MRGEVVELASYPVKGMSPRHHDSVTLKAGQGFPGDRVFGFAKKSSGFDAANPEPLPKDRFLVLLEHAALAGLQTSIDPDTLKLSIRSKEHGDKVFELRSDQGRAEVARFLTRLLDLSPEDVPFFAEAQPHRFTDVSVVSPRMMEAVSLINVASVRELATKSGEIIDPARFRGNILIDGWPPYSELDLVGQTVKIGSVSFEVMKRTRRCGATRVNPVTAKRDLDILALLKTHCGHLDMGIYLQTLEAGDLHIKDPAALI